MAVYQSEQVHCGTASTDVLLANTRTRSHSSHSKFWSSIKFLFSPASVNPSCSLVPPLLPSTRMTLPKAGLLPASRPSEKRVVTTGWHVRPPAILTVVGDVPTLPPSFQDRSLLGHALPLSREVDLPDERWSLTSRSGHAGRAMVAAVPSRYVSRHERARGGLADWLNVPTG